MSVQITRSLLEASLALTPPKQSASEMRRDAELRFDGAIPAEFLDAIKAQERIERANRPTVTVAEAQARLAKLQAAGPVWPKEPTLAELNARLVASMQRQPKGCIR